MKYLLLAFLFTTPLYGQSVSVSPTSIVAWGRTSSTILVDAEYKDFSLIGLFATESDTDNIGRVYEGTFIGLFYSPIHIGNTLYAKGGAGWFHRKFPTFSGAAFNFRLQVGVKISSFSLEYSHISNGFKIRGKFNTGIDNISLRYHF